MVTVARQMAQESALCHLQASPGYSKCVSEILAYSLACKMFIFKKTKGDVGSANYLQNKCHRWRPQLLK